MINRDLSAFVKRLMPSDSGLTDNSKPVSVWTELDRLRGHPEKTVVAIFRTRGCSWYRFSSCSMCGYFNDVSSTVTSEDLMKQIDSVIHYLGDTMILKIFTSGSFLDTMEFPAEARDYFYDSVKDRVDKLLIESRTEYIVKRNLEPIQNRKINTRIAIGVESTNDEIIKNSINKGTGFSKFVGAAKTCINNGFEVRSYLLLKPPFLSEAESVIDVQRSISDVATYSTDISVNPMNIQKNTLVEYLWKRGLYRPPRLWSLARILLWASEKGFSVVSYPTGGNRERGVHNSSSDENLLKLIVSCSLTQDFRDLSEYVRNADLSQYYDEIECEDLLPVQFDYNLALRGMKGSSAAAE